VLTLSPRHQFRKGYAESGARPARSPQHRGQLRVRVPARRRDVEVRPGLPAGELADEHAAEDHPGLAVLGVAKVGDLAAQEDPVVGEHGQPPDPVSGVRGGSLEFSIGGDSLLLGGDVIVTVNGTPATDPDKFATLMRGLKVGDKLKLKLYRDEKYLEVDYVLPERPLLPGDLPPSHSYLPGGSTAQP